MLTVTFRNPDDGSGNCIFGPFEYTPVQEDVVEVVFRDPSDPEGNCIFGPYLFTASEEKKSGGPQEYRPGLEIEEYNQRLLIMCMEAFIREVNKTEVVNVSSW